MITILAIQTLRILTHILVEVGEGGGFLGNNVHRAIGVDGIASRAEKKFVFFFSKRLILGVGFIGLVQETFCRNFIEKLYLITPGLNRIVQNLIHWGLAMVTSNFFPAYF